MKLEELKTQAQKILEIEPTGDFVHKTFSCSSGGQPRNVLKLPIVHGESEKLYSTVRNGDAYSGSITIECRDTGTKDMEGRSIYLTPAGDVFVYRYRAGSAESFDSGSIIAPKLEPASA